MTPSVIGFAGLGRMGQPMAAHLVAAGFQLWGFDAAGTEARLPPGAVAAASVEHLAAGTDTMLLSLPDGSATLEVVDAIRATALRRVATVVDLSTVGPAVAADAAARLAGVGVAYVDGPVSGGVAGARARTISLMYAGSPDVLADHRPVFEAFAGHVFHVGSVAGQGQAMKLLNNYLSAAALACTSEALAFGRANGLELSTMLDVVNVSSGRNTATADKFPNRVLPGTYDAGFRTALMAKDLRLFLESTGRTATADEIAQSVSAVWQRADAALPGSDFTEIWRYVSGAAGA